MNAISSREIIDRLGGYRAVAAATGNRSNTVVKWAVRGIPSKLWPEIVRMARKKRVSEITIEALEAQRLGRW